MLPGDRCDHSRIENQSTLDVFAYEDQIAPSNVTPSPESRLIVRYIVHIVAEEASQRAGMARIIFQAGHHAEVYTDASELVNHCPSGGIVLVHESKNLGATVVCTSLADQGLWLPVIGFGAEVDVSRIVAGMKAGAMDFLMGQVSTHAILAKLSACALEAESRSRLFNRRAEAQLALSKLSFRERQVLNLVAFGMSSKTIARELGISYKTVEIHRMNVLDKFGANSSADAVRISMDASAE